MTQSYHKFEHFNLTHAYLMNRSPYKCFFYLLLPLLCCCTANDNAAVINRPPLLFPDTVIRPVELDTRFIADAINANGRDVVFFCGITSLHGKAYFIYLDKKDSLSFIAMETRSVRKTCIAPVLKKMDEYYISIISNNQLLLLNNKKKTFYAYAVAENFTLTQKKELPLNQSGALNGINFQVSPDATRFVVSDSLLFINYSCGEPKNFIGKTAFIRYNLNSRELKPAFAVAYPSSYNKERIYLTESVFDMPNDSSLVFGYAQSDVLGLYNTKNNTVTQTSINRKPGYIPFDEKKEQNLGYVSKYLCINENNSRLFSDSLQRNYLFKRLAKARKTDTTVMECYVFDSKLNPIHSFKLNRDVCAAYIYKYQKGFLAFTKDFTKAYYYEF